MADVESVHRLELTHPLCPSRVRQTSLFGLLDNCSTAVGRRLLRSNILQPPIDVKGIRSTQECIGELQAKPSLLLAIENCLQHFHSVDRLSQIVYRTRKDEDTNASQALIGQAVLLKDCLEAIPMLFESLFGATSACFGLINRSLQDQRYPYILHKIREVIETDTQSSSGGAGAGFFQRLYAVRAGINTMLDMNRGLYSQLVDQLKGKR